MQKDMQEKQEEVAKKKLKLLLVVVLLLLKQQEIKNKRDCDKKEVVDPDDVEMLQDLVLTAVMKR